MQLLHRPVLLPITLSPPTTRALRRNRWQPAPTNLLVENQCGYLLFLRTLAALFLSPFVTVGESMSTFHTGIHQRYVM
jgi:hypothetical protein